MEWQSSVLSEGKPTLSLSLAAITGIAATAAAQMHVKVAVLLPRASSQSSQFSLSFQHLLYRGTFSAHATLTASH